MDPPMKPFASSTTPIFPSFILHPIFSLTWSLTSARYPSLLHTYFLNSLIIPIIHTHSSYAPPFSHSQTHYPYFMLHHISSHTPPMHIIILTYSTLLFSLYTTSCTNFFFNAVKPISSTLCPCRAQFLLMPTVAAISFHHISTFHAWIYLFQGDETCAV